MYLSPYRSDFFDIVNRVLDNQSYASSRHFQLTELDNDEGYEITLELPGYKQSDVEVTIEQETLTVVAKKGERSYHSSVILPHEIDTAKSSGKLENGVLTLTFARKEETKPRKITIA